MEDNKDKDLDDLYLEALGYYASLSVISILNFYILNTLINNAILPWYIKIIIGIVALALFGFSGAVGGALFNKVWLPMQLISKTQNDFLAQVSVQIVIILYYAILIIPPFYTLNNLFT
ncbi:TPA: hypothetical protein JI239_19510 [Acinetobacter baumannii]|uniref:hypothetical protein n=1 Tax=Acinetobacter baumannii TaxID=470 RepID=UPI00165FAE78|nr:hypothetical protein [Acinetobacter baumannii]MBD0230539.1 hypothetical protein [Acinetobacter baumannii]HAV6035705.1 hypothetical protein [Acinetobacter baumannii]